MFCLKFWRVFALLCLTVLVSGCVFGIDERYNDNSIYCKVDNDCVLYNCANCGNRYWVEKNIKNDLVCEKQSRVTACGCVKNVCKRELKK